MKKIEIHFVPLSVIPASYQLSSALRRALLSEIFNLCKT